MSHREENAKVAVEYWTKYAPRLEKPWKYVEIEDKDRGWVTYRESHSSHPFFSDTVRYRLKPLQMSLNGLSYPLAETQPLEMGEIYYMFTLEGGVEQVEWENSFHDNQNLAGGLVQLTAEAAQLQGNAVLSWLKSKHTEGENYARKSNHTD